MAVKKGDRVRFQGRDAKVMAHPNANGLVRLHVGQGQIIEDVSPDRYTEIAVVTEKPAPKPKAAPKAQPKAKAKSQGTAPRQKSKPMSMGRSKK